MTVAVHVFDGFLPSGQGFRALCWCGWFTVPFATRSGAADALAMEHDRSALTCRTCWRPQPEIDHYGAPRHLTVVIDPASGHARLECAGGRCEPAPAAVAAGPGLCLV